MSQIYIKEPPTHGKVLLKTTLGDMDIELWSKETPLACRNFVQLCLEGYYNGTMFHRIVPEFIAQGGDPTGTGEGGESAYGSTFKDEFHSRLKFNRRGLVGMANGGRDDNSSQFFITLNRTDELSGKHTLFGKVTGDTLYNMIRLNEIQTDKDGRPHHPPKILKTKVLFNPFDDIVPRIDPRKLEKKVEKPKNHSKATKNFGLLSFGEEAEDDEEQVAIASKDLKIKSSHDVLTDPKLSSEPALETTVQLSDKEKNLKKRKRKRGEDNAPAPADNGKEKERDEEEGEGEADERAFDRLMKEKVKQDLGLVEDNWEDELDEYEQRVARRTEKLREESKQLKLEMKQAQRDREEELKRREQEERERDNVPDVVKALRQEQKEYKRKKKSLKGSDRERQTLDLLEKFKSRLVSARGDVPPAPSEEGGGEEGEGNVEDEGTKPEAWFSHQITFRDAEDRVVVAKDANMQGEDTYDITDPRHPLNKRRRAEGEALPTKKRRERTRN